MNKMLLCSKVKLMMFEILKMGRVDLIYSS